MTELLAQTTPPTQAELGLWLACFFALVLGGLSTYWLGRQIYLSHFSPQPEKRVDELYVTHGQFDAFKVEMKLSMADLKREIKDDIQRELAGHLKLIEKLDDYTRDAFLRCFTALQTVTTGLAWLKGALGAKGLAAPEEE